jgi:probable HAF family extracellular repeat protein
MQSFSEGINDEGTIVGVWNAAGGNLHGFITTRRERE